MELGHGLQGTIWYHKGGAVVQPLVVTHTDFSLPLKLCANVSISYVGLGTIFTQM